jgi:hypothetical protein
MPLVQACKQSPRSRNGSHMASFRGRACSGYPRFHCSCTERAARCSLSRSRASPTVLVSLPPRGPSPPAPSSSAQREGGLGVADPSLRFAGDFGPAIACVHAVPSQPEQQTACRGAACRWVPCGPREHVSSRRHGRNRKMISPSTLRNAGIRAMPPGTVNDYRPVRIRS